MSDEFEKTSSNGKYWIFEHQVGAFDTIDPHSASDKEIAELVASQFAYSEHYTLKIYNYEDGTGSYPHSLVRLSSDHLDPDKPTKEAWQQAASFKYVYGSQHTNSKSVDVNAWIVDTLLAGFGIAQMLEQGKARELVTGITYNSLQEARREFAFRQAEHWRELVKDATDAGETIPIYGKKSENPADDAAGLEDETP